MERKIEDLKEKATKACLQLPDDVDLELVFDQLLAAENDMVKASGSSPWQLLIGRAPPGLGLEGVSGGELGPISRQAADSGPSTSRMEVKRVCWQAHVDWGLSKQAARAHMACTRAYRE